MICATCGKTPQRKTVATKTRKLGKHTLVEARREALVCDCGVLVWDPSVAPLQQPYVVPYSNPAKPSPNMSPNFPPRLPQNTCAISGAFA